MRHRHTQARCAKLLLLLVAAGSPALSSADPSSIVPPTDGDGLATSLPEVTVVGSTPLTGSDLDRDQVPETTRVLDADDIDRSGIPSFTGALLDNVASVTINDTEGNVFQPDILFRGFTASPVAGTPRASRST